MTIDCSQLEVLAVDYVDGVAAPAERAAVETHLDTCPACREWIADQRAVLALIERAADVEVPPQLITRIVHQVPELAGHPYARGGGGFLDWLLGMLRPVLQPKFAMGMAMTILSFSMLGKFVAPVKQLKPSDLDPVKVWVQVEDKAHRTWDRGVKYYESLRLVWEIRAQLRELNGSEATTPEPAARPDGGASKSDNNNKKPVTGK